MSDDYYGSESYPDPDRDFWESRPILSHIHQSAVSRRRGPWAVLLNVLINVTAHVPPGFVLPPIVGGYQPLNLIGIAVGGSGVGKDSARAVANSAVIFPELDNVPVIPLGSAQGISKSYKRFVPAKRATKDAPAEPAHFQILTDRAIFTVTEVNTAEAHGDMSATLRDQIKQAWTGSELGYGYADPEKRIVLDAMSYRFALIIGAQPTESNWLLQGAGDGFPQRLIWLPAHNLYSPKHRKDCPEMPAPILWKGIEWPAPKPGEYVEFRLPEDIEDRIWNEVGKGNETILGSGLDGHKIQGIERVAIALAVLDGRIDVTHEDWRIAEKIFARSDETRTFIEDHVKRRKLDALSEKAKERVLVDIRAQGYQSNYDTGIATKTYQQMLLKLAEATGPVLTSVLIRSLTANLRPSAPEVLERMDDDGVILRTEGKSSNGRIVEWISSKDAP
ncbi:hypothetical protein [Rhodococcus sp. H29-C3]|uniref:hypothetical protein n=1 Tax=Rhodococcus sp. H29-C3 TaxID=3046307 RepID=UPI0024B888F8|nr:hypothetical protein [Rhodococcus sp. H29-C3]MDJ0360686.1 hypothetical protein [Rhodococcus sp. H29-C3]